jgi:hypothetical protein
MKGINFVICGEDLYNKGVDGIFLRCLGDLEAFIGLVEVHDGICGA